MSELQVKMFELTCQTLNKIDDYFEYLNESLNDRKVVKEILHYHSVQLQDLMDEKKDE